MKGMMYKMNIKCGLVSISFRQHTPEEILCAMQKAGLSVIEWGSDVHAPCTDREKVQQIVALQEKYGIICCSYGTYFRIGVTPKEELKRYIATAKLLGTDILRLWCGNKNYDAYTIEEKEALFAECRALAQIAEAEQVVLCMECHNNTFTNVKEGALELMAAVNSTAFRMYWQPNQNRTAEENIAYASLLGAYTKHIHVFNWKGPEKLPLMQAVEIWKAYLRCFPLDKDRALLLEFMPDNRIESLSEEGAALAKIAGQQIKGSL